MLASRSIRVALVVLALTALAAGCRGQEKGKASVPPPARHEKERPREAAAERPHPKAEAKARDKTVDKVVKRVATAQGPLQIVRHGEPPEYSVVLGDRTLVKPSERTIEVASVRSAKAHTKLVLLRFPSKEKDCPALFRVVEVSKGKDPRTSDEFGNCSPKARASTVAAGWRVSFPKTKAAPAKAWVYADGDLREAEAKKASRKAAPRTVRKDEPASLAARKDEQPASFAVRER